MVPPKVAPSLHLTAHYLMSNWASDQNIYRSTVMVEMVATVVMGVAIKMATETMAI
jgi:hypothetical protein